MTEFRTVREFRTVKMLSVDSDGNVNVITPSNDRICIKLTLDQQWHLMATYNEHFKKLATQSDDAA